MCFKRVAFLIAVLTIPAFGLVAGEWKISSIREKTITSTGGVFNSNLISNTIFNVYREKISEPNSTPFFTLIDSLIFKAVVSNNLVLEEVWEGEHTDLKTGDLLQVTPYIYKLRGENNLSLFGDNALPLTASSSTASRNNYFLSEFFNFTGSVGSGVGFQNNSFSYSASSSSSSATLPSSYQTSFIAVPFYLDLSVVMPTLLSSVKARLWAETSLGFFIDFLYDTFLSLPQTQLSLFAGAGLGYKLGEGTLAVVGETGAIIGINKKEILTIGINFRESTAYNSYTDYAENAIHISWTLSVGYGFRLP
jgi:hypothetical protein